MKKALILAARLKALPGTLSLLTRAHFDGSIQGHITPGLLYNSGLNHMTDEMGAYFVQRLLDRTYPAKGNLFTHDLSRGMDSTLTFFCRSGGNGKSNSTSLPNA